MIVEYKPTENEAFFFKNLIAFNRVKNIFLKFVAKYAYFKTTEAPLQFNISSSNTDHKGAVIEHIDLVIYLSNLPLRPHLNKQTR